MFENVSPDQESEHYQDDDFIEEFEHKPLLICIPKIEPIYSSTTDLTEDISNAEAEVTPIPLTTPYKIKDPIILLERCDKIWETLKLIKNSQDTTKIDTTKIDTPNALPSEITTSKPLYIEYQPVLGNNNTELPNFKFYVKSKKRLFHCSICGRQYTENRTLRCHSEKVHGIYIAPRRYHKNPDKVKEKHPNIVEREEDDSEKLKLNKSENKLNTVASSLQHVSSSNNNTVVPNIHPRRSKSNSLVCNNSNIRINESTQNEQEKKLTKEVRQHEKVISTRNSTALSTCTLCKQVVRNIKKHLTDYHKIESPDFMLKNLDETCTILESNKLKRKFSNDENEVIKEDTQNKRQKLCKQGNVQQCMRQCDICLGIYTLRSFYGHIKIHRSRGETKENFHLATNRYFNSPIYLQSRSSSTDTSSENTDKYNSVFCKNKGKPKKIMQNENKSKNISDIKYYDKHKHICSCGRKFRNPYTLFLHTKTCTVTNDVKQPRVKSHANRKSQYDTRSESGRDSGLGISITIKKKNDSYEIIDKDNTSEDKIAKLQSQNSNHSKDFNVSKEVQQLSKYSEKHSILKIQSADEDIDIDIEEDLQTNSCNDIISDFSSEIISNLSKEEVQQKIKTEPNDIPDKKNVKSKLGRQSKSVNFAKRYNICVCGSKFYTKKALEIHTNKHYSNSLLCGYCKISFSNAVAWNEHQCSVNEGKRFTFVPMELKCYHCSEILNTYKKFDEHVKNKHSDPVVPFQCFQCSKRFPNTASRKLHFDADHGVTTCSICNSKCYDVMKSRHEAYHYGLGFPCHYCKRTYGSKKYLLKHMKRVPHHSPMESIMN